MGNPLDRSCGFIDCLGCLNLLDTEISNFLLILQS
jgi:hypothetical protein